MSKITAFQLLALYVGGEDGPKRQDASDDFTGECHIIKILVADTSFSVLSGKNQADATTNFLTANNLASKTWAIGDLVSAPIGGYFSAFTANQEVEYYKLPDTEMERQEP